LTKANTSQVVIVGAGPSGLVLALLLAKKGIRVTVFEKASEYDKQPRASFYSLPALHELRRAGLMEEIDTRGFHANGVSWRYIDGPRICSIYAEDSDPEERQVSLPLDKLIPLIASHLEKEPSAEILLSHEVIASGQDERHAWVDVKAPDGEKRFEATYLVGCDGGSSKIRRDLFGKTFPGHTWDKQIVATNVRLIPNAVLIPHVNQGRSVIPAWPSLTGQQARTSCLIQTISR
jgi:2-polyprenyl-6-methoxyphenol hydroxylase-like FAD-dependent oxidoreductase